MLNGWLLAMVFCLAASNVYAMPPPDYFDLKPEEVGVAPFDPNWDYAPDCGGEGGVAKGRIIGGVCYIPPSPSSSAIWGRKSNCIFLDMLCW